MFKLFIVSLFILGSMSLLSLIGAIYFIFKDSIRMNKGDYVQILYFVLTFGSLAYICLYNFFVFIL